MVIGPDFIREMRPDEVGEVDTLLRSAFLTGAEADLVTALRDHGDVFAEMVVPWDGKIGAYAALSRMRAPDGWLCLAPVAVLPEYQRGSLAPTEDQRKFYSFGTRLVSSIAQASNEGYFDQIGYVVAVGNPSFYRRCRFSSQRARKLASRYSSEFTFLAGPGDTSPAVALTYPTAFDEIAGPSDNAGQ